MLYKELRNPQLEHLLAVYDSGVNRLPLEVSLEKFDCWSHEDLLSNFEGNAVVSEKDIFALQKADLLEKPPTMLRTKCTMAEFKEVLE